MGGVIFVFLASLVTALACGLGALPLLFVRRAGNVALGTANAAAAGVMLAASVALIMEGWSANGTRTVIGVAAGVAFIIALKGLFRHDTHAVIGGLRGEDARKALLIVAVMTVHSTAEGVGVGAAFGDGATLGLLIAIAIAVHNIPEGLAISLVLVPRGVSVRGAAGWSIFSSLPQPLLAVPAYLFVEAFEGVLPIGLGFAAGAMIWMAARELLPEALSQAPPSRVLPASVLSFTAMLVFQLAVL